MAYKKYNKKKIKEVLNLKVRKIRLFGGIDVPRIEMSQRLALNMQAAQMMNLTTEKAVCEHLVSPVLTEIRLNNENVVDFYSGEMLNVDSSRDLNGEIDFLFSKASESLGFEAPILCITEAKIGLIDRGIPQAAAQMYGVRLFNENEGTPLKTVYGAVTDGKTWRFLKLEEDILYTDLEILYLDNLPLLLGTLQWIIDFYKETAK
jgi:hypothetical protein